jgi:hypothetical protein
MKVIARIKSFYAGRTRKTDSADKKRELLEKKVIKGTDFAVREYNEVFKKLAEYDRTLN